MNPTLILYRRLNLKINALIATNLIPASDFDLSFVSGTISVSRRKRLWCLDDLKLFRFPVRDDFLGLAGDWGPGALVFAGYQGKRSPMSLALIFLNSDFGDLWRCFVRRSVRDQLNWAQLFWRIVSASILLLASVGRVEEGETWCDDKRFNSELIHL